MICSFFLLNGLVVLFFFFFLKHHMGASKFTRGGHLKYFHFVGMINKAPVIFVVEKFM